jgi:hypothetical protein
MLLLIAIACAGSKDTPVNTFDDSGGGNTVCVTPTATIVAPVDGESYMLGTTITFTGEFESSVATNAADMSPIWAVDGTVVGTGLDQSWTADAAGDRLVEFQVTDECGTGRADLHLTITQVGG